MESLGFTKNIFSDSFFNLSLDFVSILNKSVIIVLILSLFLIKTFYQNLREKFPAIVNCWFCCKNTKIPYKLKNCWNCPFCKQYNGFNKEGDYNKVIEEQYDSKLNSKFFANVKNTVVDSESTNKFCKLCNINQQLKIQQLASFVPLNEKNFDEEVEDYRQKLEKAYKLCSDCEKVLHETIKKQDSFILQNKNDIFHSKSCFKKFQKIEKVNWKKHTIKLKKHGLKVVKCLFLGITCLQFFALIFEFEKEKQFLSFKLQDLDILEPTRLMINEYKVFLYKIHNNGKKFSLAGIFLLLLSISVSETTTDLINLIVNCLIHILFWINLTECQLILYAISLFLGWKSIWNVKKPRLEKNNDFSFQKGIVLGTSNFSFNYNEPNELVAENLKSFPLSEEDNFEDLSNKRSPKKSKSCKIKSEEKKNIKEVKLKNYEKINSSKSLNNLTKTTSTSLFNKSFLNTLEANNIDNKSIPPFDEVSTNLSELSLGGRQAKTSKSSKSSNFLFPSHNFLEKKNSSIIKPAKFIKNLSNSWTCLESNESISRSSTPSSGYSSQKQEQNSYDYWKNINSFNCSALGRRWRHDYFDDSNSFYNFNGYSQNFIPFQQFSGPMGHTAIYTYTRPTNFAFSFPQQGFSSFKYNPPSPRFSDASDCENLFQNTSKNFLNEKKWFKLKNISYCISILLNCITIFIFIYFFLLP